MKKQERLTGITLYNQPVEMKRQVDSLRTEPSSNPMVSQESFFDWEEEGGPLPKVSFSRTFMLITDYHHFKAARVIQTAARAWYARRMYRRKKRAVIMIQNSWRRFYAQRFYFRKLEDAVQQRTIAHYHRSATMIQALWRGWWVREYVHDHFRLRGMQVATAEELLHCVAFKLHHLLRTHQIPGVYSLRNSNCLSKVEKLLAAMTFKQHNDAVRLARARRDAEVHQAKKQFDEAKYSTEVPYSGPNFKGICEPKCCALFDQEDADRRMYKILELFEKATNPKRKKKKKSKFPVIRVRPSKPSTTGADFCFDIVKSMKRWSILHENKVKVDVDVFKRPHKLERFLNEIESIYDLIQERCHCHLRVADVPGANVKGAENLTILRKSKMSIKPDVADEEENNAQETVN